MPLFPKKEPSGTNDTSSKPKKPEVKKVEGPDGQAYWTTKKEKK